MNERKKDLLKEREKKEMKEERKTHLNISLSIWVLTYVIY